MQFLLKCCLLGAFIATVSALDQAAIQQHIADLQSKLCTGDVPADKLDEGEACHNKLVPPDVKPIIEKCEKTTKCSDIKKIKTGNKKHDFFLCCWCSAKQQQCLIQQLMMGVAMGKFKMENLEEEMAKMEEDVKCIADTVGAELTFFSKRK